MSKLSVNLSIEVVSVDITANVKVCDEIKQINIATMSYEDFEKIFCYDDSEEVKEKKSFREMVDDKIKERENIILMTKSTPITFNEFQDKLARLK